MLPILPSRLRILYCLEHYKTVIIQGETGSGKTTQIPQYLNEAGWTQNGFKVVCTQPRRVAAISIAARVAGEMNVRLGGVVGYAVRFDANESARTKILYSTGKLLAVSCQRCLSYCVCSDDVKIELNCIELELVEQGLVVVWVWVWVLVVIRCHTVVGERFYLSCLLLSAISSLFVVMLA